MNSRKQGPVIMTGLFIMYENKMIFQIIRKIFLFRVAKSHKEEYYN